MVAVLVLDPVAKVSVSDPDVSGEVSAKLPEFESEPCGAAAPALGGLLLAALAPAVVATGVAKRTCGRTEA
jgi:hypothetical protein